MRRVLYILLFLLLPLYSQTNITHLDVKGAIGPASSDYLHKGFAFATDKKSQLILITLDTPGGLATSMREMIQEILNSSIPVVIFVFPQGSRAASAGTYLLYAAHISAMAPGTNLGAATPVNLIKLPQKDQNSTQSAMEKKVINDSVAYIKSLAQLRHRNIEWAISAVKEGKSLSADDALKKGVIDIIASSKEQLLKKLEGKSVEISGKTLTLSLKDTTHFHYEPDWKSQFLSIITKPSIAYILLMIGIYGIFFELMNPGGLFPGIIGLISGVMALYALNVLPFSYAGLFLILLGIIFMISEVFISGFGILGIAGLIAFTLGSLLLFDAKTVGEGISIPLIIAFALSSLAFFIFIIRLFITSRSSKVHTGSEEMIGLPVEIIEKKGESYRVLCHGESWIAESSLDLKPGDYIYVKAVHGLTLILDKE